MFSFEKNVNNDWVIRNQSWHFDGHLFAIKLLNRSEQPSSVSIIAASFLIWDHDLPLICPSETVIRSITSRVGVITFLKNPSADDPYKFVRFKVQIDIQKPLLRGIRIKIAGKSIWILFTYKSLPFFCYNCGCIDHFFRSYPTYDCDMEAEFTYNATIKASVHHRGQAPKPEIVVCPPLFSCHISPSLSSDCSPKPTDHHTHAIPTSISALHPEPNHVIHPPNPLQTATTISTKHIFETLLTYLSISTVPFSSHINLIHSPQLVTSTALTFDLVRLHTPLLESSTQSKFTQLQIPLAVHNWHISYLFRTQTLPMLNLDSSDNSHGNAFVTVPSVKKHWKRLAREKGTTSQGDACAEAILSSVALDAAF
ncbi:hypothetical protein ACS0TY_001269 [Phlomoides rotata]